MKTELDLKTIVTATHAAVTETVTAFNSLVNLDQLDEKAKTMIKDVVTSLNSALEKLPPIQQVAAATDARYMVNELANVISYYDRITKELTSALGRMRSEVEAQATAFNSRVNEVVTGRIASGELIAKDQLETALNTARDQARAALLAEQEKLAARKTELATHGIPVSDEALAGDDTEFQNRLALVKPRIAEAKKLNVPIEGPVARALFAADKVWQEDIAFFQNRIKPPTAAPAARPGGHPLAGGGTPAPAPGAGDPPKKAAVIVGM